MFNWGDRATKVEVKNFIGGDNPARVVTIGYGQYEVTIPDDRDAPISYQSPYHKNSDPRHTFPNMEVRDGEMRIPLDDIVSAILSRVDPKEIAVALWANDEVRDEFMDALVTQYNERNISDADRRKFLDGVKEAVHSKALDKLAGSMAQLEYSIAKGYYLHSRISDINATLANYDVTRPPRNGEEGPQPLRIMDEAQVGEFKIGGTAWNEARDFWRCEVSRQFPICLEADPARALEGAGR